MRRMRESRVFRPASPRGSAGRNAASCPTIETVKETRLIRSPTAVVVSWGSDEYVVRGPRAIRAGFRQRGPLRTPRQSRARGQFPDAELVVQVGVCSHERSNTFRLNQRDADPVVADANVVVLVVRSGRPPRTGRPGAVRVLDAVATRLIRTSSRAPVSRSPSAVGSASAARYDGRQPSVELTKHLLINSRSSVVCSVGLSATTAERGSRSKLRMILIARSALRRTVAARCRRWSSSVADSPASSAAPNWRVRALSEFGPIARRGVQPLSLCRKRLRGIADERPGGDLHQGTHCAPDSSPCLQTFGERRRWQQDAGFSDNELLQHLSEQIVIAEYLVERRLLLVTQLPQFSRLRDDNRSRGDVLLRRVGNILANLVDQCGNVIQQQVAGKHLTSVDGNQRQQPLEPLLRELTARLL